MSLYNSIRSNAWMFYTLVLRKPETFSRNTSQIAGTEKSPEAGSNRKTARGPLLCALLLCLLGAPRKPCHLLACRRDLGGHRRRHCYWRVRRHPPSPPSNGTTSWWASRGNCCANGRRAMAFNGTTDAPVAAALFPALCRLSQQPASISRTVRRELVRLWDVRAMLHFPQKMLSNFEIV